MSLKLTSRTGKCLAGLVGIWLGLGVEVGVFYSYAPWAVLVPIAL